MVYGCKLTVWTIHNFFDIHYTRVLMNPDVFRNAPESARDGDNQGEPHLQIGLVEFARAH